MPRTLLHGGRDVKQDVIALSKPGVIVLDIRRLRL
jgi:hypothetical protein